MDEKDIKLCQLLLNNSRTPYEVLARRLDISINAVHKRVKVLEELHIIRAFVARPSLASLNALNVWIFGRSESKRHDIHLKLQENDCTYWVAYSGGEQVYVGGYLRDISELESYASFVRSSALIPEPVVGILPSLPKLASPEQLRQLDYQIISSLHKDSRKSLVDVASEIRVTPKTVRNRLERMIDNHLLDLTMDWYPDASNDILSILHLGLAPDARNTSIYSSMMEELSPNLLFPVLFANLPNQLAAVSWTNNMKQQEEVREKIAEVKGVTSVAMNVLQIGYSFETWRDKLISEKCGYMPKPDTS